MVFNPAFVEGAQGGHFIGRIQFLVVDTPCNARSLEEGRGYLILWEVHQGRPRGLTEQVKRRRQDAMLERRIIRLSQGKPERVPSWP
jgi:hypothetical protein